MNPDTSNCDDAGDPALEEILLALPRRELPPDWREPILRASRPPVWPWFTRPVRWSLAACWAAIALFHFTAPPGPAPLPPGTYVSPQRPPLDLEKFWLAEYDGAPLNSELPAP